MKIFSTFTRPKEFVSTIFFKHIFFKPLKDNYCFDNVRIYSKTGTTIDVFLVTEYINVSALNKNNIEDVEFQV